MRGNTGERIRKREGEASIEITTERRRCGPEPTQVVYIEGNVHREQDERFFRLHFSRQSIDLFCVSLSVLLPAKVMVRCLVVPILLAKIR